jgi:UDPglucose 6-dehydrogenase
MREASSLRLISLLQEKGCQVKAYDPMAMETAAKLMYDVTYGTDAYDVAKDSDALVLVTEWGEFKELDMTLLSSLMNHPIMIDGRNLFEPDAMTRNGFMYEGIGRRSIQTGITKSEVA